MMRAAILVACLTWGCGNKKSEPPASAGSGSAATGSAASGQTVAEAMGIVCNVLDRAKLKPEEDSALADAKTSVDIAKLSGLRDQLADDLVDREVKNADVLAMWNSDEGNTAKMWADMMAKANISSCAYLDWKKSIKDRMTAANDAAGSAK